MFLSRFHVKNYKCLGDIDIPLTPIHVLIGQNDSGKTSLMEAIAALYGSLQTQVEDLFPQTCGEAISFVTLQKVMEFAGELSPSNKDNDAQSPAFEYGFSIQYDDQHKVCKVDSRWMNVRTSGNSGFKDRSARIGLSAAIPVEVVADARDLLKAKHPVLRNVIGDQHNAQRNQYLQYLKTNLVPLQKYSLNPKAMKWAAALDTRRHFRMDPDGFGLPTLLDDILGYDSALFEEIKWKFCEYFPQFTGLRLKTETGLLRHDTSGTQNSSGQTGKGIYFICDGRELAAQQASDGAILFLGILALAHLPKPRRLLLLEEPENGIYPKRLGEIIQLLKQVVGEEDRVSFPQIILSTHSPYILSFFKPEEVTLLSRSPDKPNSPVRARPLRKVPNIHERLAGEEFYLGELWYNIEEEELFHGS
jgi:predicted ATPase